MKRVAVIGAGMAGLGAARELRAAGVDVTVFERDAVVGGRVRTVDVDGVPVDVGAQFIAGFCTQVLAAARAHGLSDALRPRPQRSAVVVDGVTRPLGRGRDVLTGGLLSLRARLHLAALAIPVAVTLPALDPNQLTAAGSFDRRSAEAFARRWGGDEVAEHLVDPLLRGLLYSDPATTSQAVLLVMFAAAARHGLRAYWITRAMSRLPDALASGLDVRTRAAVRRVEAHGDRIDVTTDAGVIEFDGAVCATTAAIAAELVAGVPDAGSTFLRSVSYSRTLVATYRASRPAPGGSLLFPSRTAPELAAVDPAPGGLVRVFLSDRGYETLDDDQILDAVRATDGGAEWTDGAVLRHIWRWPEAVPRFPVGSLRCAWLRHPELLHPGRIVFAGDYLAAPHLEGALRSGRAAARTLLARSGDRGACSGLPGRA